MNEHSHSASLNRYFSAEGSQNHSRSSLFPRMAVLQLSLSTHQDKSPYPIQPTYQHFITIRSYYRRASDRSEVETNNNQSWYSYTPGKAGVRPKTTTRRRNKNYAPSRLARYNGVWRSEITRRICVGPTSTTGRHVAIRFGWHRRQLQRRGGGGGTMKARKD